MATQNTSTLPPAIATTNKENQESLKLRPSFEAPKVPPFPSPIKIVSVGDSTARGKEKEEDLSRKVGNPATAHPKILQFISYKKFKQWSRYIIWLLIIFLVLRSFNSSPPPPPAGVDVESSEKRKLQRDNLLVNLLKEVRFSPLTGSTAIIPFSKGTTTPGKNSTNENRSTRQSPRENISESGRPGLLWGDREALSTSKAAPNKGSNSSRSTAVPQRGGKLYIAPPSTAAFRKE